MAQVANTSKVFNFKVEVNGVDQFEIQTVQLPKGTVEKVMHGDTNYDIKTPGRISFDDLVFEKVRPAPFSDTWAWDWLMLAQDPDLGGGQLPSVIKQNIVIKELAPDNVTTLNRWLCTGCWVTEVDGGKLDRKSSDNIIETVTLSVDKARRI